MSKPARITGWVLSVLLVLFLCAASASGKFVEWEGKAKLFEDMGWKVDTMVYIGIVEVVCAVLFLIPRTAFIGAILLSAYLGGAVATHVRVDQSYIFPIILGVVMWIALCLRDKRVFEVAFKPQPNP